MHLLILLKPPLASQNSKDGDGLRTNSARAAPRGRKSEATSANRADLGPPPEAPTLEARLRASAPSDPSPQVLRENGVCFGGDWARVLIGSTTPALGGA